MPLKYFSFRFQLAVGAFFVALLTAGLMVFQDYGVHWDEYYNQDFGRRMTNYTASVLRTGRMTDYPSNQPHDKFHGPIFEIFLTILADRLGLKSSRDIILMRHLCVFLLFYLGVIFFYLLCLKHFQDSRLALLGALFLVLSPRIFADAFYNSVDIPFLVFFLIGVFTLTELLDKKTFMVTAAHALACAVLMNIRLVGGFVPLLTVCFLLLEAIQAQGMKERTACLKAFVFFLIFLVILTYLFNPLLWSSPLANFNDLFDSTMNFHDFIGHVHYFGSDFKYGEIPWHYAPVWIVVSTPVLYCAAFPAGIIAMSSSCFRGLTIAYATKRNNVLFLICFFIPLLIVTGRIYNGWRHIYFIYPFFLVIAISGLRYAWERVGRAAKALLAVVILCCLLDTAAFMVKNHPYQNLYFNWFAGKDAAQITDRFDLDYWGLSCRKGLEFILQNDNQDKIPIKFMNLNDISLKILALRDRKRLVKTSLKKAKYVLVRDPRSNKFQGKEFYSINVDGLKLLAIYKLDKR